MNDKEKEKRIRELCEDNTLTDLARILVETEIKLKSAERKEKILKDGMSKLHERHQADCIKINELTITLNKVIDMYSTLRNHVGLK